MNGPLSKRRLPRLRGVLRLVQSAESLPQQSRSALIPSQCTVAGDSSMFRNHRTSLQAAFAPPSPLSGDTLLPEIRRWICTFLNLRGLKIARLTCKLLLDMGLTFSSIHLVDRFKTIERLITSRSIQSPASMFDHFSMKEIVGPSISRIAIRRRYY